MKQTPAHDMFNKDVLDLMRPNFATVVEVGTSVGNLAREYRTINPYGRYIGIEIDPDYAQKASQYCTTTFVGNIEHFNDAEFKQLADADCWVFADVLEHLYDPWALLRRINSIAKPGTEIIACIPNMQHWTVQASLAVGAMQYQDEGLLDRTHIRFFTRRTMLDLFESTGYHVLNGTPRIFAGPDEAIAQSIKAMAIAVNADPEQALNDALVYQWVIRAVVN